MTPAREDGIMLVPEAANAAWNALPDLMEALASRGGAGPSHAPDGGPSGGLLVHLATNPGVCAACADAFAAQVQDGDRLIVFIAWEADPADLAACQGEAALTAFIRHAALAWAGRGIRINRVMLARGASSTTNGVQAEPYGADIAETILRMRGWRSMTGQTICLAQPLRGTREQH